MKIVLRAFLIIVVALGFTAVTAHANDSQATSAFLIPEPASLLLLGIGLAGIAGIFRRRLRSRKSK